MTGYELITFILENRLLDATVEITANVNVKAPAGDEDFDGPADFSSNADEAKGNYRGGTIELTCEGDIDVS